MSRRLTQKELRELPPTKVRALATHDTEGGLVPEQVARNRAWYAAAETYDDALSEYLATREAIEAGGVAAGPLTPKPRPFWGHGPRPALPPCPPIIFTNEPGSGRPASATPLYPVPIRLPLAVLAKIEATRGEASVSQFVQNLVCSVLGVS